MRALLVANPHATATTPPRTRDVLARALAGDLKVDVAETQRRGHAIELAGRAVDDGIDVVVVLGGDGTVNEVVNGLLAGGPRPGLPALAVVPAGSANVVSRSLGLPSSAVAAIGEILDALRAGRRRRIGLGRVDERWFVFCAGLGLDAEVVDLVERRRRAGRRATPWLYVGSAIRHFYTGADRRHPPLTLHRPGHEPTDGLFLGIVSNNSPWTYLGSRPVAPSPRASFDTGLDLLALRRLGSVGVLRVVRHMLTRDGGARGRAVLSLHDLERFSLHATRPVAVQVDGDFLGTREVATFTAVPAALDVVV